ncbi:MAG: hypothetical protein QME62_04960, partial [Armatimonadota bacterium]|nr:hypothetical protein [Armatimonadota bacterium]
SISIAVFVSISGIAILITLPYLLNVKRQSKRLRLSDVSKPVCSFWAIRRFHATSKWLLCFIVLRFLYKSQSYPKLSRR